IESGWKRLSGSMRLPDARAATIRPATPRRNPTVPAAGENGIAASGNRYQIRRRARMAAAPDREPNDAHRDFVYPSRSSLHELYIRQEAIRYPAASDNRPPARLNTPA